MDSALECLVYALNALGNGISASEFQDVSSTSNLKKISSGQRHEKGTVSGYGKYFPSFQSLWIAHGDTGLRAIVEQHDVSESTDFAAHFPGGFHRMDPPEELLVSCNVQGRELMHYAPLAPFAEIYALLLQTPNCPFLSRWQARKSPKVCDTAGKVDVGFRTIHSRKPRRGNCQRRKGIPDPRSPDTYDVLPFA